ncbi:MAG: GHKL domain-containing protein [Lachnospiraceae bacterium]|nr:GHKL domain-containing protein [Lachnospiraceae bacterium]
MTISIQNTSFFFRYFGSFDNFLSADIGPVITLVLLIFLTIRAGKYKKILLGTVSLYAISIIIYIALILRYPELDVSNKIVGFFIYRLPDRLALISFLGILILSMLFWRKENRFYRTFGWMAPAAVLLFWIVLFMTNAQETVLQLALSLESGSVTYILYRLIWPIAAVTLITALLDALRSEVDRRMERHLLEKQRELTLAGYENLRRQHEEVMVIRHDMMKHFHTLNNLSTEKQVKSYLEEIIGQNQKVRSIVQTGNEMLDIILNSKLCSAMDAKIQVEIVKAAAPSKLPVSDADLCSLIMNILDNAINAASSADTNAPYIQLDIHEKNQHLAISCKNSANVKKMKKEDKKETVPKHGLGMKIIGGIIKRYHGLFDIKYGQDYYKIQIAIPLS